MNSRILSPSSRGRGLKYLPKAVKQQYGRVALFTRAWIEMQESESGLFGRIVALFTRAWIEII